MLIGLICIVHLAHFINSNHGHSYTAAQAEATQSYCPQVLAPPSNRTKNPFECAPLQDCQGSLGAPFVRPQVHSESQNGLFCYGKLSMALQLRKTERQTPQFLSWLPMPLDAWSSSFKRAQVAQTHRGERAMELDLSGQKAPEERKTERKRSQREREKICQRRRERPQRQKQGTWGSRAANPPSAPDNPSVAIAGNQA